MTLSKKQIRIIWGTVIIAVLLLGLVSSETDLGNKGLYRETRLYGIRIYRDHLQFAVNRFEITNNFIYSLAKNKASGIIAVVIIGLTLLLTLKKK